MVKVALLLLLCAAVAVAALHPRPHKPHVAVFVIDDLGWTDVGYRAGSGMLTPFLDTMAKTGTTAAQCLHINSRCCVLINPADTFNRCADGPLLRTAGLQSIPCCSDAGKYVQFRKLLWDIVR